MASGNAPSCLVCLVNQLFSRIINQHFKKHKYKRGPVPDGGDEIEDKKKKNSEICKNAKEGTNKKVRLSGEVFFSAMLVQS